MTARRSLGDAPAYTRVPVVPEAIADDLIYAFKHGWIKLPIVTASGQEASERLTRLHTVRRFADNDRG